MKALSIKQPYAALIACGTKTIETRGWKTKYRGPLLICCAKKAHENFVGYNFPTQQLEMMVDRKFCYYTVPQLYLDYSESMICIVDLVDVHFMSENDVNASCAPKFPGAFSWVLENPRLVKPIPVRGKPGLFDVPENLIEYVSQP